VLEPVASIAKSVIRTATLGEPLELDFDPRSFVKNLAYFTWRNPRQITSVRGFAQKAQDFYNRVKLRVDQADISNVQRKSLANLKLDLDSIVDSIVEQVRASEDGLFTDYLQTRVNGVPLEDACTAVGIQLKAYGVDLTNYRNIAGMVLGIPVMPTVASAMVNVANMANLDTMRDITSNLNPLNSPQFLNGIPNSAIGQSVSLVSNSIDNLRQQLPVQHLVQTPFTLLSSGQRLLMPQQTNDPQAQRQPVFA
jgi:hypothetical protein